MKAVFLDKDGTLIADVPYNVDPARVQLAPGAETGLQRLHRAGYLLIVITNQSGVAHGYFPESALVPLEARLRQLLQEFDVPLAGFYYCPHHPEGAIPGYTLNCGCRKPASGLLLRAAQEHGIALEFSWLVGDILHDIEAGRRAGCRTVLIDNGNETEWQLSPVGTLTRTPHYIVADLAEAGRIITANQGAMTNIDPGYRLERTHER